MNYASQPSIWLGFDPGGINAFGVAVIDDTKVVATGTVSSVIEALEFTRPLSSNFSPRGVGIDAPLWWSARAGGGRLVDAELRRRYKISSGTIQTPNSLRGAALAQGLLIVERLRAEFPSIIVTEAHPKALLRGPYKEELDCLGGLSLRSDDPSDDDHERDAILAALAAREGDLGNWTVDLSALRYPEEQDPRVYWASPVNYFWPQKISNVS